MLSIQKSLLHFLMVLTLVPNHIPILDSLWNLAGPSQVEKTSVLEVLKGTLRCPWLLCKATAVRRRGKLAVLRTELTMNPGPTLIYELFDFSLALPVSTFLPFFPDIVVGLVTVS